MPMKSAWRSDIIVMKTYRDSEYSVAMFLARNACTLAKTNAETFTIAIDTRNPMDALPSDEQYP